jgi:hypothetical protein
MQSQEPSGSFDTGEERRGHLISREPGALASESSVHLDGSEYPIRVLSTVGIYVQLTADVAEALAGGTALATRFRRTGIGRVRKDLSTPLEPAADRVWIQAVNREALLVWRRDTGPDHAAFFRLGQLSPGARSLADSFGQVQVLLVIANDFLPEASVRQMQQLVEQQDAWGALIACTADG